MHVQAQPALDPLRGSHAVAHCLAMEQEGSAPGLAANEKLKVACLPNPRYERRSAA